MGWINGLNLSMGGMGNTKFSFYISGLGNGLLGDCIHECWCVVGISIKNRFFNYKEHNEILGFGEVQCLRDSLDSLLRDEITEDVVLSFVEPDIEFKLNTALDLRTLKNVLYVKEGYGIQDISVDLVLNLTGNGDYYILPFSRREIELLLACLNKVIPQLELQWEKARS
jgi:hypothetical protein